MAILLLSYWVDQNNVVSPKKHLQSKSDINAQLLNPLQQLTHYTLHHLCWNTKALLKLVKFKRVCSTSNYLHAFERILQLHMLATFLTLTSCIAKFIQILHDLTFNGYIASTETYKIQMPIVCSLFVHPSALLHNLLRRAFRSCEPAKQIGLERKSQYPLKKH